MLDPLREHLPNWLAILGTAAVGAGLALGFVGIAAFLAIWAERKVSARMQDRLGPTRTGRFGLLQSLADGIKLITKEDTTPTVADPFLFRIAPYLAFIASFSGFLALPFGPNLVGQNLSIGVFFILAVLSGELYGVLLAGFASGSKWSLFGGVREAAQVVSYEAPRSLCVVASVCCTGTLSLTEMGRMQAGGFWNWTLFHDPFTFVAGVLFFIASTASCKRAPFDLAEAESELVAGFHTEYSGFRWSIFFLAEYASMFAVSGLTAYLFLGGWHTGFLPANADESLGPWLAGILALLVFVAKCSGMVGVMMWIRWSLPRLRIDQVMLTCLKYFLPISCGLLIGVAVWQVAIPHLIRRFVPPVLASSSVFVLLFWFTVLLKPSGAERGQREGAWSVLP